MKEVTDGIFSADQSAFDALVQEFAQAARKEVFAALVSRCTKDVWARVAIDACSVSSAAWENLGTLISKAVKVKAIDDNSDQLWIDALEGLHDDDKEGKVSPVRAPQGSPVLACFEAFTEALITKCCIKSFTERSEADSPTNHLQECHSAVSTAAFYNEPAVIGFLHTKGADLLEGDGVSIRSPASIAFEAASTEAFLALLDSGEVKATSRFALDPLGGRQEGNFQYTLIHNLMCRGMQPFRKQKLEMVETALQRDPTAKDLVFIAKNQAGTLIRVGLLELSVKSCDCGMVRAAIKAGAKICVEGGTGAVLAVPTAASALQLGSFDVLKLLLEECKLPTAGYGDIAVQLIEQNVCFCLRGYLKDPQSQKGEENFNKAELFLRAGFDAFSTRSALMLLVEAVQGEKKPHPDAFARVLSLFISRGLDLKDIPFFAPGFQLIHLAVLAKSVRALDMALAAGCDPNAIAAIGDVTSCTPLSMCMPGGWVDGVAHLVSKGSLAAVEGLPDWKAQPLTSAVGGPISDDETLEFIRPFKGRQPDMLSPRYYKAGSDGHAEGPLLTALKQGKYKCLEWLLTEAGIDKGLPERSMDCSVTQFACFSQDWVALSLLIRHADASVTISPPIRHLAPNVTFQMSMPVHGHAALQRCPDRRLRLLIEAKAKTELEAQKAEAYKEASESKAKAVGAATNAFEDPTNKVLTAAEEKKKAKKKQAKKKAKAKKKAAAASKEGNAGAGKEADGTDSDSDDSSGSDEEAEGMDEEERMLARAPTFDLEKEKAARKARAEAEAREKKADETD
jgi:hypothetical protein